MLILQTEYIYIFLKCFYETIYNFLQQKSTPQQVARGAWGIDIWDILPNHHDATCRGGGYHDEDNYIPRISTISAGVTTIGLREKCYSRASLTCCSARANAISALISSRVNSLTSPLATRSR